MSSSAVKRGLTVFFFLRDFDVFELVYRFLRSYEALLPARVDASGEDTGACL